MKMQLILSLIAALSLILLTIWFYSHIRAEIKHAPSVITSKSFETNTDTNTNLNPSSEVDYLPEDVSANSDENINMHSDLVPDSLTSNLILALIPSQTVYAATIASPLPSPTQSPSSATASKCQSGYTKDNIKSQYGIIMSGNWSSNQLKTVADELCILSKTKFLSYVKGTTVLASNTSEMTSTTLVKITGSFTGTTLKIILTHELSHIIRYRTLNFASKVQNAIAHEGYVTYYAAHARECTGSNSFSEDYAEMLTYYINPQFPSKTAKCSPLMPNPYTSHGKPLHYAIAKEILEP